MSRLPGVRWRQKDNGSVPLGAPNENICAGISRTATLNQGPKWAWTLELYVGAYTYSSLFYAQAYQGASSRTSKIWAHVALRYIQGPFLTKMSSHTPRLLSVASRCVLQPVTRALTTPYTEHHDSLFLSPHSGPRLPRQGVASSSRPRLDPVRLVGHAVPTLFGARSRRTMHRATMISI